MLTLRVIGWSLRQGAHKGRMGTPAVPGRPKDKRDSPERGSADVRGGDRRLVHGKRPLSQEGKTWWNLFSLKTHDLLTASWGAQTAYQTYR